MRIAVLVDQSGSMQGIGDALVKAFCIGATPQTMKDGEMTLITYGRDAQVKCVDAAYVDFMGLYCQDKWRPRFDECRCSIS